MSRTRDWTIDVIRIASLALVVLMHWTYTQTYVDESGALASRLALHGTAAAWATWVLQVMPLFFLAGGFANTMVVDSLRAKHQTYGDYLGLRARRLTTPMVLVVLVMIPVVTITGAFSSTMARQVADHTANPLWFLAVYLGCVALAPVAIRAHEISPWLAPALLIGASLAIDSLRFFGGVDELVQLNLAFVWLACHQWGIVYARGTLGHTSNIALAAAAICSAGLLVLMTQYGPWFPTVLGLRDAPVSNLAPPTAVLPIVGFIQLCLLTVTLRFFPRWHPTPRTQARIGKANAMLMVIYLWHVPVLIALTGAAIVVPVLLPENEALWWALRPLWWLVCALVLWAITRLAVRWELWINRYSARTSLSATVIGTALSIVGTFIVWSNGLSLQGWSLPGVIAILTAAILLSTRRRVTDPHREAVAVGST